MKILFVGPTLSGLVVAGRFAGHPDIDCRGPAAQGDIARAVIDGASVIGLVDGRYEDVAAPWHKEILWALSNGVAVLGAGSLGALRAAECAAYGMVGIGEICARYMRGELHDDADVAQLHGPAEMDHLPLSEAFVNVEATLRRMWTEGVIDEERFAAAMRAARSIFFKNLDLEAVAARLESDEERRRAFVAAARRHRVDQKRADALELVARMADLPARRADPPSHWRMAEPLQWLAFLRGVAEERTTARGGDGPRAEPPAA
ncbi:MAG: TfuA-like protein [Siculibacillus sp.]|nr:TfuA-like protein [Siculibacillus sp.]